jgi:phage tail P2-like protein
MSDLILPSSLQNDPHYQALSQLLDRWQAIDLSKLLIYWINSVDAGALPHLAKQFHVLGLEGWDYATTESEKRELLKQAVELHRYRGTPWAVRQGIRRIHPDIDIEEWSEYDGEPYRFRLRYDDRDIRLTIAQALKLYYTIETLKSLRSKLEGGITAIEDVEHELTIATHYVFCLLCDTDALELANAGIVVLAATSTRIEAVQESVGYFSPYINPTKIFIASVTRMEMEAKQ